tara:strand:+ start:7606 stop:8073 length:468 start_codon:yes stop_codon:yes gene_type:complete
MIFKRRQAIPVGPGMMCTIKPDVIEIAKEKPSYSRISAAYDSEQNNQQISSWRLKKSRQINNQIPFADISLAYVKENSVFGNEIVEIIPLAISQDEYGYGVRKILTEGKSFLVNRNSLSLAKTSNHESLRYNVKQTIYNLVNSNYNLKEEFSWQQ